MNAKHDETSNVNLAANLPVGIFDSGVGGLTVYRALHERLPRERFVYLGDTARVPYGTKSLATVERYAVENATFLAARGIKLLVVACNTASSLALPAIQNAIAPVKVVGVIAPGAHAAVEATLNQRIGVIATEATINSNAYKKLIEAAAGESSDDSNQTNNSVEVYQQACPLFVALAEEGETDGEPTRMFAEKYLRGLREAAIDTLVLGCTHYPILRDVIERTVGANVTLIDSGVATAESVARLIETENIGHRQVDFNPHVKRSLCDDLDHFYVTDAAERFARVAERFLGVAPRVLEAVEVFGHDKLK